MCREVLHHALVHPNVNVREYLENDPEAYYSKDELLEPLTLIYNSLLDCGDKYIAHGRLLDCIRQVSCVPSCWIDMCVALDLALALAVSLCMRTNR